MKSECKCLVSERFPVLSYKCLGAQYHRGLGRSAMTLLVKLVTTELRENFVGLSVIQLQCAMTATALFEGGSLTFITLITFILSDSGNDVSRKGEGEGLSNPVLPVHLRLLRRSLRPSTSARVMQLPYIPHPWPGGTTSCTETQGGNTRDCLALRNRGGAQRRGVAAAAYSQTRGSGTRAITPTVPHNKAQHQGP